MHIGVDFCLPSCLIFQSLQAQQAHSHLWDALVTYISVAVFRVPRNVPCYVSTASWAEFAGKKEFIFYQITFKPKKGIKLNLNLSYFSSLITQATIMLL